MKVCIAARYKKQGPPRRPCALRFETAKGVTNNLAADAIVIKSASPGRMFAKTARSHGAKVVG